MPGCWCREVIYVKRGDAKTFLIVDAGMNDLIRPALYDSHHEIVPVREPQPGAERINYDVVGPVCETSDLFAANRALPELKSGDLGGDPVRGRLWRGHGLVLQCPPPRAGGLGQGRGMGHCTRQTDP